MTLMAAAADLLRVARNSLSRMEDELALIYESHCTLNDDGSPRRETLEECVRAEVADLEIEIRAVRMTILKAEAA